MHKFTWTGNKDGWLTEKEFKRLYEQRPVDNRPPNQKASLKAKHSDHEGEKNG